ncbi:RNA binding motif protein 12Ba [Brachionichthys hirsutus]|uniref:RNA binding motif protein 12Ba n=1 Tax=Brachionichthys hirsutus TaxID=412623 RepID=UPI00360453EE
MTTILRLRGLDEKAGAEDIRMFFKCLHIPTGGIYIVGGSLREAFIAFSTERNALRATRYSGKLLKGSKVTLKLSSMKEVEYKLKVLLKTKKVSPVHLTVKSPASSPEAKLPRPEEELHSQTASPDTSSPSDPWGVKRVSTLCTDATNPRPSKELDAFLLGTWTGLQNLQSSQTKESNGHAPRLGDLRICSTDSSNNKTMPENPPGLTPGYVRLFGLPPTATKRVIGGFFKGLAIMEAIVNVKLGLGCGCLVKFASEQEASDALRFNRQPFGACRLDVRGATEKMWRMAKKECENACGIREGVKRDAGSHKRRSFRRPSGNRLPPDASKTPRFDGDTTLSSAVEYRVMIRNLPNTFTKTEIKALLKRPDTPSKNVLHLLDKNGFRTDTAFVYFDCDEDYDNAMSLSGCHAGSKAIEVSSITEESMRDIMDKASPYRSNKTSFATADSGRI